MSTINEQNAQSFINYTGPVPGQSLTNSPDSKQPWELPPQFVNKREAELYILEELTEKEKNLIVSALLLTSTPDIIMQYSNVEEHCPGSESLHHRDISRI